MIHLSRLSSVRWEQVVPDTVPLAMSPDRPYSAIDSSFPAAVTSERFAAVYSTVAHSTGGQGHRGRIVVPVSFSAASVVDIAVSSGGPSSAEGFPVANLVLVRDQSAVHRCSSLQYGLHRESPSKANNASHTDFAPAEPSRWVPPVPARIRAATGRG